MRSITARIWSARERGTVQLLYEFTVEDSDYTATYSGSLPWPRTDNRLYEYACHEGNYSMGAMLRGARLLEKEWQAEHGR